MSINKLKNVLLRYRSWLGYILFFGSLAYSLYHAPKELWQIRPLWLLLAALGILVISILQVIQVRLFLRAHRIQPDWLWPSLFTAKKGFLNAILPVRIGTIALIYLLTQKYPVKWHDYVRFSVIATIPAFLVSGLAFAWLILQPLSFFLAIPLVFITLYLLATFLNFAYFKTLPELFNVAIGLYLILMLAFWCVLMGLGFQIGFRESTYFAVALNTLAQVSITPGNMGVREMMLGFLAPYISLPMSVAMLAGGIFHILRIAVNGIIMLCLEWWIGRYSELEEINYRVEK